MKTFYLLRHEDLHGHSGLGVVAEGVIFDNGLVAMTWLSRWKTVTMFSGVNEVRELHSHEGRTELVIEGRKKLGAQDLFDKCKIEARAKKSALRRKAKDHDKG